MSDVPPPSRPSLRPELAALWRHRALIVVVGYAFIALVGALYYVLLLADFGLNAFDYWEASDFLLAAFREPLSIAFGIVALFLYVGFTDPGAMNDRLYGRWPWLARLIRYERWRNSPLMAPRLGPLAGVVLTLVWFLMVMGGFATRQASDARRGRDTPVHAQLEDGTALDAQLLTATNRFVFLVVGGATPAETRVLAIPVDAIARLEQCGLRRGGLAGLVRGVERCEVASPANAPATAPAPAPAPATNAGAPATRADAPG